MIISGLYFGDPKPPIQNISLFEPALIDPNNHSADLLNDDLSVQNGHFVNQPNSTKAKTHIKIEGPAKLTKKSEAAQNIGQPISVETTPDTSGSKSEDIATPPNNGATITGWVHDEHGVGVADQIIQLRSPTHRNKLLEAKSNTEGIFTLESVEVADDYRVVVKISGPYELKVKRPAIVNIFEGMPDLDVSLLNTGAGKIGITIYATSGYPIAEQPFQLLSLNRVIDQQRSNALGYVEFTNVPATGGRPNLMLRSVGSPIYLFSNLSLTRGQNNTALRTQVHHGEHSLLVTVKNEAGQILTDINAKLIWTKVINGVLSKTVRVIDNSLNGRNVVRRAQQQASNPERTLIRFTGLGSGEHRLVLIGSQAEASYGEPILINQYDQHVVITMQSLLSPSN